MRSPAGLPASRFPATVGLLRPGDDTRSDEGGAVDDAETPDTQPEPPAANVEAPRSRWPSLPPSARTEGGAHRSSGDDDLSFHVGDVVLSTYVIERQLGRGGMGAVYLGRDDVSGQRVAIKVLPAALAKEQGIRDRFVQEARALAALDHPGIVPLITFAQDGEDRFLVMKYVSGRSLDAHIDEHRVLSCDEARRILREVVTALGYAHDHGVVHRDIKPANVVVGDDGRIVVVDFGIARQLEGEKRLTQTGMLMGTPQYMSPEQIQGRNVDGRGDLYACGLVLFEMLSGRPPFDGDKTYEILKAHVEKPVPDLRTLRAEQLRLVPAGTLAPGVEGGVPDELVALVHALLEKDPAARPQRGEDVVDILDGKVALAPPPPPPPPTARFPLAPVPRPTTETPALAFDDRRDDEPIRAPANPAVGWAAALVLISAIAVAVIAALPSLLPLDEVDVVEATRTNELRFQVGALIARAEVAFEHGAFDDARVAVDTALHLDDANVEALLLRARILLAGNNRPAATASLRRLPPTLSPREARSRAALQALIDAPVAVPIAEAVVDDNAPQRAKVPALEPPPRPKVPALVEPPARPKAHQPKARPRPSELSDAVLGAIMHTSSARAKRCYVEHLLSIDGTAEGEVTLAVTVVPAGSVSAASVKKSPFTNDAFHECLVEATKIWKFKTFDGDDDVVVQKLYFRPG